MTIAIPLLGLGLLGLAIAALVGWFGHQRRAQAEIDCGFEALRTLSWKEFAGYVVQAFEQRGFQRVAEQRKPGDDGVDHLLERQGQRHLLQIKHGGAYHVSAAPVRRMLSMLGVNNATGGILATSGRFDAAAREAALRQPVVLLDGEPLWAQLRPLLPAGVISDLKARVHVRTRRTRLQMIGIAGAALALLLAGALLLAYESLTRREDADTAAAAVSVAPSAPAAGESAAVTSAPTPAAPAQDLSTRVELRPRPSDEELAVQRELAAASAIQVDGVVSASWPTRSTLLVAIRGGDEPRRVQIVAAICKALMQREDLRFTRLQVHDYAVEGDVKNNVRWHQCR